MGMNIKDPQVHAMARQLAARRGTTLTDAVRQALAAELERSAAVPDRPAQLQQARREELQAELYDEHGLPI